MSIVGGRFQSDCFDCSRIARFFLSAPSLSDMRRQRRCNCGMSAAIISLLNRDMGPETVRQATGCMEASKIGAAAEETPSSRSATLSEYPRSFTSLFFWYIRSLSRIVFAVNGSTFSKILSTSSLFIKARKQRPAAPAQRGKRSPSLAERFRLNELSICS